MRVAVMDVYGKLMYYNGNFGKKNKKTNKNCSKKITGAETPEIFFDYKFQDCL